GARTYRVQQHIFSCEFSGDRFGEGDKPALAGRIDRLVAGADAGSIGGNIDNPAAAAFHHQRRDGVVGVEGTIQIDADDLVPEILVRLEERHRTVPAGVVDENPD